MIASADFVDGIKIVMIVTVFSAFSFVVNFNPGLKLSAITALQAIYVDSSVLTDMI